MRFLKVLLTFSMLGLPLWNTQPVHAGNSTCFGRTPTILGTNGPDTLVGTPQSDVIAGLRGKDKIFGKGSGDFICGGAGDPDVLHGNRGFDHLDGGSGADHQFGGSGADVLRSGGGALDLFGDQLDGGAGSDRLLGDDTRQEFTPGPGDDVVIGRDETDSLLYTGSAHGIIVNLVNGKASGQGFDQISGVEDVTGSRHTDTLLGDSRNNLLLGGQVQLGQSTGAGNDVLRGSGGKDFLGDLGCLGQMVGDNRTCSDTRNDALFGGRGRDVLTTLGRSDFASGGRGRDSMFFSKGSARLVGGRGRDSFKLRKGFVRINGRAGRDTIRFITLKIGSERPPLSPARVDLRSGSASDGTVNAKLVDVESVYGTLGDDTLLGDAQANKLVGLNGDDHLIGRSGDDLLAGGRGTDFADGGTGRDHCRGIETKKRCEVAP